MAFVIQPQDPIEVCVNNGEIRIGQYSTKKGRPRESFIFINPSQIGALIRSLQQAKKAVESVSAAKGFV